jgi:hypothetical protein
MIIIALLKISKIIKIEITPTSHNEYEKALKHRHHHLKILKNTS